MNVSDEYYRLSKFMPRGGDSPCPLRVMFGKLKGDFKGTHMTWGLNFAYDNATNAVNMAQSVFRAFSPGSETIENGVVLDSIELGMSSEEFASAGLTYRVCGRKRA